MKGTLTVFMSWGVLSVMAVTPQAGGHFEQSRRPCSL